MRGHALLLSCLGLAAATPALAADTALGYTPAVPGTTLIFDDGTVVTAGRVQGAQAVLHSLDARYVPAEPQCDESFALGMPVGGTYKVDGLWHEWQILYGPTLMQSLLPLQPGRRVVFQDVPGYEDGVQSHRENWTIEAVRYETLDLPFGSYRTLYVRETDIHYEPDGTFSMDRTFEQWIAIDLGLSVRERATYNDPPDGVVYDRTAVELTTDPARAVEAEGCGPLIY